MASLGLGLGLLLSGGHAAGANGYRLVHEFTGENGTGRSPTGSLVQGPDGKLYGTATYGGASRWGDVFRLSTGGAVKVMHSFKKDGPSRPLAGLTLGRDGNLYGTTAYTNPDSFAGGAVFRMSLAGEMTVLHEFDWRDGAGESPNRTLLEASNGSLYGVSSSNGSAYFVWRLPPGGELTAVHQFTTAEGFNPSALIEGPDGHLYGVAQSRGAHGFGSAFRMTLEGELTVLHHFDWDGSDVSAAFPNSLMLAADGHFYGTTTAGGRHGHGTVFRMSTAGEVTLLHEFEGGAGGEDPVSPLLQASNGNFYGTTGDGGANDWGVVYRLSPDGQFKVLHYFSFAGGHYPTGGLLQASDGRIYGTGRGGEDVPAGFVYSIKAN